MEATLVENADAKTLELASKAAWRSNMYKLIGLAFAYPDSQTLAEARAILDVLNRYSGLGSKPVRQKADELRSLLVDMAPDEMEEEYLQVFTHVFAADCNPCETSYTSRHLFQLSQQMADIMGFYRAFGLAVSAARADHITVELEFMAFMTFKEASAVLRGETRRAAICRRGQRKFLRDHLARWAASFADLVQRKVDNGLYALAANLLKGYLAEEAELLGAKLVRKGRLVPLTVIGSESEESVFGEQYDRE